MKITQSILVSILTFAFFYLLCAFYSTTFDISKWTEFTRYVTCFLGGLFSPTFGLLNYFKEKL